MDQSDSALGDSLNVNDTSLPPSHNNDRPDSPRESPSSSPVTANAAPCEFCVNGRKKRYQLENELFNLKLRLYFLEEKNPLVEKNESLCKENVDLKFEIDALQKDLKDKLDRLDLANAEILEQENANKSELEYANNKITELKQKNAEMTSEIFALDAQLLVSKDSKLEMKAEWKQKESQLKTQIQQLEYDKENLSAKIASMKDAYEFLDKKLKRTELSMKKEKKTMEAELNKLNDLWGTTQRDLWEAEEKLKEKDIEAKKAFMLVKSTMTDFTEIKNFTKKTNKALEEYCQKLKEFEERHTEYEMMDDKINEAHVNKKKIEVIRNQESDIPGGQSLLLAKLRQDFPMS